MVRYEFSTKKIAPFFEAGISPNFYLTTRNKVKTNLSENVDYYRENGQGFNKVNFVANFSFGVNYTLTEQLQLAIQPTFRYHLSKIYSDVPVNTRLYNFGLELGLRKKLN